jgi:hypothetical protein
MTRFPAYLVQDMPVTSILCKSLPSKAETSNDALTAN